MNDSTSPELSVVVPVFNEAENIKILQAELATTLAGTEHEIIFVDDGSTDATAAHIERSPRVRVIQFEKNRGQVRPFTQVLRKLGVWSLCSLTAISRTIRLIFRGWCQRLLVAPIWHAVTGRSARIQ